MPGFDKSVTSDIFSLIPRTPFTNKPFGALATIPRLSKGPQSPQWLIGDRPVARDLMKRRYRWPLWACLYRKPRFSSKTWILPSGVGVEGFALLHSHADVLVGNIRVGVEFANVRSSEHVTIIFE